MYKEAIIIAKVKEVEGNKSLDIPFTAHRLTMVKDNQVHYDFSNLSDGDSVLALVSYMAGHPITNIDDTDKVLSLGDDLVAIQSGEEFQNSPKVRKYWWKTNKDVFLEQNPDAVYEGEDGDKLHAFYPSSLTE